MIESAIWTNVHNGEVINFNTDEIPFHIFTTDVEWRQDQDDRPQEHGAYGGFPYLGTRLFHVEGDILENEAAEYIVARRSLVRSLMPSARYGNKIVGNLALRFTGMTDIIQSACTLDGWPELPMEALMPARGSYMINWKSFDPRLYATVESSNTTGVPGVTSGITFPVTFPISFTVPSGITGDLAITQTGDIETYPRFAVVGPCVGPALTKLSPTPIEVVEFGDLQLAGGQTLYVDFEARTAVLSSGEDVYYTLTKRQWWALDKGVTNFRYSAFSASSPSAATIFWRNAFMI